jgi:Arc/MetJ-type ribon-helix-helix transcriptional regulator
VGSRKSFSAGELLTAGRARSGGAKDQADNTQTSERRDVVNGAPARYRRVTVYLTEQQYRWAKRVAASAVDDGPTLSASDVVRLALERLKGEGGDLRPALIEQAWTEAATYPGRAKRGMPARGPKGE